MRKILICLLVLITFTVAVAYAGAGHSHGPTKPVSKEQALEKATSMVKIFVKKEKLDASWAEVAPATGIKKQMKSDQEWVITFINPKVEDETKQTLYVFLNVGGEYLAANFSGK